jgi:hypothetical protein
MAATDFQSLLSDPNVACYMNQPPGIQRILELALLQLIAENIGAAAGGGGSGVVCGNYGGGQPNFTPTTCGNAVDTSNGRVWWYYNGAWN